MAMFIHFFCLCPQSLTKWPIHALQSMSIMVSMASVVLGPVYKEGGLP